MSFILPLTTPPESPFSKGDLKNSPLIKGERGLFVPDIYRISKKVAADGSLINSALISIEVAALCDYYIDKLITISRNLLDSSKI